MDVCDECEYAHDTPRAEIAARIRELPVRYEDLLTTTSGDHLRAHTVTGVWSPLEYACHMRDVLDVQRKRILQAIAEDVPTYVPMRRDERVGEERYNEQDPKQVTDELTAAARALADTLDALDDAEWSRTGIYNYPVTQEVDVAWIGRRTIHEGIHHLVDIKRLLAG